jgi:preprotein translocase subunit SecA
MDVMEEVVLAKVEEFTTKDQAPEEWNIRGLADWVNLNFPLGVNEDDLRKLALGGNEEPVKDSMFEGLNPAQLAVCRHIVQAVREAYELKVSFEASADLVKVERYVILSAIDRLWQEHLYAMDSLRNSIGLRAYGQRDPLIEYKAEAFQLFDELMVNIKSEICHGIFRSATSMLAFENFLRGMSQRASTSHPETSAFGGQAGGQPAKGAASDIVSEAAAAAEQEKAQPTRTGPKVGRNDPCPCGSGKKYKQCCGKF